MDVINSIKQLPRVLELMIAEMAIEVAKHKELQIMHIEDVQSNKLLAYRNPKCSHYQHHGCEPDYTDSFDDSLISADWCACVPFFNTYHMDFAIYIDSLYRAGNEHLAPCELLNYGSE